MQAGYLIVNQNVHKGMSDADFVKKRDGSRGINRSADSIFVGLQNTILMTILLFLTICKL